MYNGGARLMPIYNKRKTVKYLFQFFTFNKVACKLYINVSLGFVECDPRHITETKFFLLKYIFGVNYKNVIQSSICFLMF